MLGRMLQDKTITRIPQLEALQDGSTPERFTMMEVRCCCQPRKLLGWLPVVDRLRAEGRGVRFVIPPQFAGGRMTDVQVVNLPIAMFVSSQCVSTADGIEDVSDRHLALKSEETPIEILRRIPGFQDADPVPIEYERNVRRG
jgi:hypothetical protein